MKPFRDVLPSDAGALLAMERLHIEEGVGMVRAAQDLPSTAEYEGVLAKMLEQGFFGMLIAEDDEGLLGYAQWRRFQPTHLRHVVSISMGVHPRSQGQGVGTRLLQALLAELDALGVHRVELSVLANNARARRLYERCGFVIEGTRRDFVERDGTFIDDVLMARIHPHAC